MKMKEAANIDDYIADFPEDVQKKLNQIRSAIRKAIPKAEEAIKYGIPTYVLNGNVVHFGGFKNHIGFYPAPGGIEAFRKELSVYEGSKGTIKFPLDQPLPTALIARISKFRAIQNQEKIKSKSKIK
jgi:uncharacterized protein YdhG (YjbR/CyaY superfamily)